MKKKVNLSDKITNPINLGQLSENTVTDFLAQLQEHLKKLSNLKNITTNDYDVYKAETTNVIQDSDVANNSSLNIKIVAKGNKFEGEKDNILVNYTKKDTRTNLSGLSTTVNVVINSVSVNKVLDFKHVLINELKKEEGFNNLQLIDIDITKTDDDDLQDSDIIQGSLIIKVKADKLSQNFYGKQVITVNITVNKINLDSFIKNKNLDKIFMFGDIPTKAEILVAIKEKNTNANILTENDFDFDGTPSISSVTIIGKGNYEGRALLKY